MRPREARSGKRPSSCRSGRSEFGSALSGGGGAIGHGFIEAAAGNLCSATPAAPTIVVHAAISSTAPVAAGVDRRHLLQVITRPPAPQPPLGPPPERGERSPCSPSRKSTADSTLSRRPIVARSIDSSDSDGVEESSKTSELDQVPSPTSCTTGSRSFSRSCSEGAPSLAVACRGQTTPRRRRAASADLLPMTPNAGVGSASARLAAQLSPELQTQSARRPDGSSTLGDDEETFAEYALHLGVNVQSDEEDLAWLVREAFDASLPRGWKEHIDEKGNVFYHHEVSMRSTWYNPKDTLYAELVAVARLIRADETAASGIIEEHIQAVYLKAVSQLQGWSGPFPSKGGEYFYNDSQMVSTFQNPVETWEEELILRENVLRRCRCRLRGHPISPLVLSSPKKSFAKPSRLLQMRSAVLCIVAARRLADGVFTEGFGCQKLRRRSYQLDAAVTRTVIKQIDLDISRTAGEDERLRRVLGVARSLLLRHAAEDPELGYCQGMNNVAALFVIAEDCQSIAYDRFHGIVHVLRGLWLPGFPLLEIGALVFSEVARHEPWFQHIGNHGVGPDMYLPRFWMALFAMSLPLDTRLKLLPLLEVTGLAGLVAATMALLEDQATLLLNQMDQGDILQVLRNLRHTASDSDALLIASKSWLAQSFIVVSSHEGTAQFSSTPGRQRSNVTRLSRMFVERRASAKTLFQRFSVTRSVSEASSISAR